MTDSGNFYHEYEMIIMVRHCFVVILLFVIVIPVFSQSLRRIENPEINPDFIQWLDGDLKGLSDEGFGLGYIPHPCQLQRELPEHLKSRASALLSLPPSFDLRVTGDITSVKYQGGCGSCWAFASMSALESHWKMIDQGIFNLSEDNLNTCHPPFVWPPCQGGNDLISLAYFARGSGPLSESDDPYSAAHTQVDCPSGFRPQGWITSGWLIPTDDPDLIKSIIMQYGALFTSMYWSSSCFNYSSKTYYYSGHANPNHGVALAGWDDSKVTAGGTGAWIAKNSWGTGWGEGGYFYIAYQDSRVNSDLTLFRGYIADDPLNAIDTYSESGWSGYHLGYGSQAADALVKFVASGSIQLTKIGTWAGYPGTVVTIDIYDDFNGTDLLTGLLASMPPQTCTYLGYETFELSSPVYIEDGDYYIQIRYETTGYNYPIPVEGVIDGYCTPAIETGVFWSKSTGSAYWNSEDSDDIDPCVYAYTGTVLGTAGTPFFDPEPGTYMTAQQVAILCATPDAVIRYTTNGTDPTESDSLYESPIVIDSTMTLKARSFKSHYLPSDTASGTYTIQPPVISVTAPNGDENWEADSSYDVMWTSTGTSGNVCIEYSTNSGSDWSEVISGTADDGIYSWTVPDTSSDNCMVRISDTDGSPVDTSDGIFIISIPSVRIQIKIWLEGAYVPAGDSMSVSLQTGALIPTTSPYSDSLEVETIPSGITDWIFVELRSTPEGEAEASRSFFIRKDGWITDLDGLNTNLEFENVKDGSYYMVVRHRNHLSVMSKEPVVME